MAISSAPMIASTRARQPTASCASVFTPRPSCAPAPENDCRRGCKACVLPAGRCTDRQAGPSRSDCQRAFPFPKGDARCRGLPQPGRCQPFDRERETGAGRLLGTSVLQTVLVMRQILICNIILSNAAVESNKDENQFESPCRLSFTKPKHLCRSRLGQFHIKEDRRRQRPQPTGPQLAAGARPKSRRPL